MYCSEGRFVDSLTNTNKHVRSLFVHSDGRAVDAPGSCSYWKSYQLLKVLYVAQFRHDQNWPNAIGGLIGLRYLAGDVDQSSWRLPRSFNKLENIQFVYFPASGIEVPDSIWKRVSLHHLKSYCIRLSNLYVKVHTLKNLQTLAYIRLQDPFIEQLTKMPGLRKLGLDVRETSDGRRLFAALGKLENLGRLHLRNCGSLDTDGVAALHCVTQLKLRGGIGRLPGGFPPNLSCLKMEMTELEEDPMPVLEKLPNLLHLKLDGYVCLGEKMEISDGGFRRLKQLCFSNLIYVCSIRVGEGAMPQLQRWDIVKYTTLNVDSASLPEHLRSKISYK